jgi:hypothetical protein
MQRKLIAKMTPRVLPNILEYFDLLLRLDLISETAHAKAKSRIIDLVMNNM